MRRYRIVVSGGGTVETSLQVPEEASDEECARLCKEEADKMIDEFRILRVHWEEEG
jgi:hypothetical protein